MKKKIKLCIFDLDGTLANTILSMAVPANRALRELGLPEQPADSFRYFAGDGAAELCRRCLRAAGDTECTNFPEMHRRYRQYFSELCMYEVKPYEGIPELLENLKQAGVRIAVLSNKPHAQAVDVVETLFGKGYFDAVQGQTDEVPRKPSPIGVYRLLEIFQVSREECLYIGDTATDMQTGNNAGLPSVGVLWGFREKAELEENKARYLIRHPREIMTLLEGETDDQTDCQ